MEGIDSSIYSSITSELIKSVMMQNLNAQIANSAIKASDEVLNSISTGGYEMDSEIPEGSTVSYHV